MPHRNRNPQPASALLRSMLGAAAVLATSWLCVGPASAQTNINDGTDGTGAAPLPVGAPESETADLDRLVDEEGLLDGTESDAPSRSATILRDIDPEQAASRLMSLEVDERITAARRMFTEWTAANRDRGVTITDSMRSAQVRALLRGLDIESLTAGQVERLAVLFSNDPAMLMPRAQAHAQRLADDETATGAVAQAAMAAMDMYASGYPKPSRVNRLLQHPGLLEALRDEQATELFVMLERLEGWGLHPSKDILFSLHEQLDEDMSPETIHLWTGMYPAVSRLTTESDRERAVEIRETLLGALQHTIENIEDRTDDQWLIERIRLRERAFAGYWGHEYLEGLEAPSIEFQHRPRRWRYDSLRDLRGKVVIIDFFTTWSSPSLQALPNLRRIHSRYRGYDVEVISLTSLQGWHAKDGGRIPTTDDPQLEYDLMVDFARDNRIEWPVVFGTLPVTDAAYGVESFPHLTIIDPDGIVRYNQINLNTADVDNVIRAIDGILEDHNMRRPLG